MSEWKSASEPPEHARDVWARIYYGRPFKAWYGWVSTKDGFWRHPDRGTVILGVTHWREIEPPK